MRLNMIKVKRNAIMRIIAISCVFTLLFLTGCTSSGKSSSESNSNSSAQSNEDIISSDGNSAVNTSNTISSNVSSNSKTSTINNSKTTVSKSGQSSSSSSTTQVFKNTYAPLGRDIMPIGAWVSPPPGNWGGTGNANYITNENYKTAKESGLNFLISLYERAESNMSGIMDALNFSQANGLKYIVTDSLIQTGYDDYDRLNSGLSAYKNHPAFMGNMLSDEPSTPIFELLGECQKNFTKAAPNSCLYVNLLPNYATKNQLFISKSDGGGGNPTKQDYQNYLDQYVTAVKPKYLSYDYYPISDIYPTVASAYFENMSAIRYTAKKSNIPFWVFIQSCSFGGGTRIPTKSETFWQVNTSLAYGAKGIQYFTYWQPIESNDFAGSMITKTGQKTPIYYDVQEMNRQVAAVDSVLMNSNSKGLIVYKTSAAPVPVEDKLSNYKELTSVSGNTPMLIGCFDYNGKSVYYVVNNTINKDGNVTLNFSKNLNTNVTQNAVRSQKAGKSITINLNAGEGALVEIN
jgi:hypothetical protein